MRGELDNCSENVNKDYDISMSTEQDWGDFLQKKGLYEIIQKLFMIKQLIHRHPHQSMCEGPDSRKFLRTITFFLVLTPLKKQSM
jgi:hypothetical protein